MLKLPIGGITGFTTISYNTRRSYEGSRLRRLKSDESRRYQAVESRIQRQCSSLLEIQDSPIECKLSPLGSFQFLTDSVDENLGRLTGISEYSLDELLSGSYLTVTKEKSMAINDSLITFAVAFHI
jgi:hypothetical protein